MIIKAKTWVGYIDSMDRLNKEAGRKMSDYIAKHGTEITDELIAYAQALVQKYGEGSAELACQMYDAMARASGVQLPPAEPAAPADISETARMVNGTRQSPPLLQGGVSRLVKQTAADTTLKNAIRDGAEFAWVPHGDSCAFCMVLASRGWQRASKAALKNGHAEHIHANCDCEYAVRFDGRSTVAGYDPEQYLARYKAAGGDINELRRGLYAKNRDRINAQKRAAWAARKLRDGDAEDVLGEYLRTAVPGQGSILYDDGYDLIRHADEVKTAQWLHDTLGGDIVLLNEAQGYKILTPDYRWRGKLWDLKSVTTEKAANSAVRHGLKQIQSAPGGVILNYGENSISLSELKNVLKKRMEASAQFTVDILVIQQEKLVAVLRYKK